VNAPLEGAVRAVPLLVPVAQTFGMACAGMLVALVAGIPLAVAVATRAPGYRFIATALGALRAIPDLTLAILAVVVIGLGPAAGIAALAVFYTAMIGKVFGELLLAAPSAPVDALKATGAGRVSIAAFGLIPLTSRDLLSFGAYAFDCAVRASVIVGAVGAGGLGTELVGAINALDYRRAALLILILVVMVAVVDAFGALIRRYPRAALALIPIGLLTLWLDRPQFFALGHALTTFAKMLPPQLNGAELNALPLLLASNRGDRGVWDGARRVDRLLCGVDRGADDRTVRGRRRDAPAARHGASDSGSRLGTHLGRQRRHRSDRRHSRAWIPFGRRARQAVRRIV